MFVDHVFDQGSSNAMVYELLTKDIIHAAVQGFNGTFPPSLLLQSSLLLLFFLHLVMLNSLL